MPAEPLPADLLARMDAYWRAANYLSVGQIYLRGNPLLATPLALADIKPRLLGHWGTTPGLNLLYVHLNRMITTRDLDMIYIIGPGHGGPGIVAHTYLEGSYGERFPGITSDRAGMQQLFRQFSWPYGIPSHVAPETPGSIHEGGELGYSLAHAYGAAFDNPDLIVACVVGDGEAETGPLAASWHANKFLNPARDGAVLPILHLNGYKIANPTVLARIGDDELAQLMRGYGYTPHFVEGDDPATVHQALAATLDTVIDDIQRIQAAARVPGATVVRPRWPMIVLKTPKGWTGPKQVDGPAGRRHLARAPGADRPHRQARAPAPARRLAAQLSPRRTVRRRWSAARRPRRARADGPASHGHEPPRERRRAVAAARAARFPPARAAGRRARRHRRRGDAGAGQLPARGRAQQSAGREFPGVRSRRDGVEPTRCDLRVSGKQWLAAIDAVDVDLGPEGRVMEILSEHLCEGWLEGYLLTGRHGLFSCYEAFVHIVDSMFNQHAKWLKACRHIPWRRPIASLNYLLTSHVWRQDHNGFSHQDPGFIDHVANKSADVVRIYLPPDANTLLSVADHCLRSRNYVNVIVAGKQPAWQWLGIDEAVRHCTAGAGVWSWAGTGEAEPDVVMACAGDVPTLETLAAVTLLRQYVPDIAVRVVNVVDLMSLQPAEEHPHGMDEAAFDALFTRDKPVVFAFHGYPSLIHKLTYRRHNHANIHVRGYKEEGTTTTPFDMVVLNNMDRYQLAYDAIRRIPRLADRVTEARERYEASVQRHRRHVREHGEDLPEVRDWRWQ